MHQPPIGVTVVTPAYAHLEKEAVRHFRKFSGLKVMVIRTDDASGFLEKMSLDKHCKGRRIVFFDVDAWLIQRVRFKNFGAFCAVNDAAIHIPHTFPHDDCRTFGLNPHGYFNSGLFIADLANPKHRELFVHARTLYRQKATKRNPRPVDKTDQFWLNKSAQDIKLPINWMPFVMNMYTFCVRHGGHAFYPRKPMVIHAAGYPLEQKQKALECMEFIFGGDVPNMQPGAVDSMFAKTYQI